MRNLTQAQHEALETLADAGGRDIRVIGWSEQLQGPMLAKGKLNSVVTPEGSVVPQ